MGEVSKERLPSHEDLAWKEISGKIDGVEVDIGDFHNQ